MHLRGVLSPTCSRSPMNISLCIDEIQVAIYILIKWKSNPALAWESKPHVCWWRCWCEWDAIVCLSVPHRVKTLWQSFLFYKHDDNNNPWHAWLHKKRLTLIRIVLALCHWDGIEIPGRVSHSYMCRLVRNTCDYHKKAKQSDDWSVRCFFFFFSRDVAAEKGDYALLLFAAVGERKSLFPLHVSCQLLRCVNC